MFRAYLYKLIRSPLLYVGIAEVMAICSLRLIPNAFKGRDVVYEMSLIIGIDGYRKMFIIMGALPFAANFADEWNTMAANHYVIRTKPRKYAAANIMICVLSSTLTVFVGMTVFAGIYSLFYPFYIPTSNPPIPPYGVLETLGFPFLSMAANLFVFAVSCAMWSAMGLMLSAFFPNKYIAICSPFIFSYVVERLTMQLPTQLNLYHISLSYINWTGALGAFLYSIGLLLGISVICGIVFTVVVGKRVHNEWG